MHDSLEPVGEGHHGVERGQSKHEVEEGVRVHHLQRKDHTHDEWSLHNKT